MVSAKGGSAWGKGLHSDVSARCGQDAEGCLRGSTQPCDMVAGEFGFIFGEVISSAGCSSSARLACSLRRFSTHLVLLLGQQRPPFHAKIVHWSGAKLAPAGSSQFFGRLQAWPPAGCGGAWLGGGEEAAGRALALFGPQR